MVPRETRKRTTPEGFILGALMEYLAARRIFALRMNSGAIRMAAQNGRTRVFKGHEAGTADILAFQPLDTRPGLLFAKGEVRPVWIEAKAPNGIQSELQKLFQIKVESEGHRYILARGIEDLRDAGL
jgi:hypothetical protein